MILELLGVLRGNGYVADCIVRVDPDGVAYLADEDVTPPMLDGEFDLEINGVHMRAVRLNCVWKAFEY